MEVTGIMRIITGSAKGRKLRAPEGLDTRPTADRVKESIFNIIASKIYDAKILDLFAGTGNLGLEAISRGSNECTFIEFNKNTFNILNENIKVLEFNEKSKSYNNDAKAALSILHKKEEIFDVIFLDPPYGKKLIETSIIDIDKFNMLDNGGIIISEYDINDVIPDVIGKIKIYRTEKYGRTKVSFWTEGE